MEVWRSQKPKFLRFGGLACGDWMIPHNVLARGGAVLMPCPGCAAVLCCAACRMMMKARASLCPGAVESGREARSRCEGWVDAGLLVGWSVFSDVWGFGSVVWGVGQGHGWLLGSMCAFWAVTALWFYL